jgi:hypothetical protein
MSRALEFKKKVNEMLRDFMNLKIKPCKAVEGPDG